MERSPRTSSAPPSPPSGHLSCGVSFSFAFPPANSHPGWRTSRSARARTQPSRATGGAVQRQGAGPAGGRPCLRRHPRALRQRVCDLRAAQRLASPGAVVQVGAAEAARPARAAAGDWQQRNAPRRCGGFSSSPRRLDRGSANAGSDVGAVRRVGFLVGHRGKDAPFLRDYSFHDSSGGILWLFVDRLTGTSWVQGAVD